MKPVVNLAFNETMSFEMQRMSSETSLIWQSRSLVRDSGSKGNKWAKGRLCGGEYQYTESCRYTSYHDLAFSSGNQSVACG